MSSLMRLVCAVLVAALLTGCGRDGRLAVYGTVKFKGQPLDQGTIEFHPPGGKGIPSGGDIKDGKYSVPRDKGLLPATYEVRIFSYDVKGQKLESVPGEPGLGFKQRIATKYNTASTLKADVKPGSTTFDFSVD